MNFLEKLNKKQGERVFLDAQSAMMQRPRPSAAQLATLALCLFVLFIPIAVMAAGVWVVGVNLWNGLTILGTVGVGLGMVVLWLGYVLLPSAGAEDDRVFGRDDMPILFSVLDDVADALGAQTPDGVVLTSDIGASMTSYGLVPRRHILKIGVPLWGMLDPQERVAVLAHELAHFVNGDLARGYVVSAAMDTTNRWLDMWSGEQDTLFQRDIYSIFGDLVQWALRLPVQATQFILMHLQFYQSQRSEYLADGLAARVAGRDALISSLKKLLLAPVAHEAVRTLYPYREDQGTRIFDVMVAAARDASDETRLRYEQIAAQQKTRVDLTHPPTIYRIAFLELMGARDGQVDAASIDFGAIALEMKQEAERQGNAFMRQYEALR